MYLIANKRKYTGAVTVFILMLSVFVMGLVNVQAHGESYSIETVADGYLIDIGQTPEIVTANESVRFAFDLLNNETNEFNEFTDVWVIVQKDGKKTIFASGIHQPEFGSTGMTFTFPEAGEYELSVRYQNDGESIVKTTAPITVVENPEEGGNDSPWLPLGTGVVGCLSGFALAFMLRRNS